MPELFLASNPEICFNVDANGNPIPPTIPRNTLITIAGGLRFNAQETIGFINADPRFTNPFTKSIQVKDRTTGDLLGSITFEWRLDEVYNAPAIPVPIVYPWCLPPLGSWVPALGEACILLEVQFQITNQMPGGGDISPIADSTDPDYGYLNIGTFKVAPLQAGLEGLILPTMIGVVITIAVLATVLSR